jgi:hypothetical protein
MKIPYENKYIEITFFIQKCLIIVSKPINLLTHYSLQLAPMYLCPTVVRFHLLETHDSIPTISIHASFSSVKIR